ncbi:hypothetical protein NUU61_005764 [Penicillium alfredii]|uniref:Aminoglycoside phosphotransferase domain-containing protein n=1 Tax=Penicillium alfredii TaxID=1506179 RepID=A0A9W9FA24_9EURO|nr:uncharacterized protein NUU61_005764 [Penicillium alfredii]KAJ5096408.1 hypothetical protein NUU61_005764 [Penicillium alfredii]
MRFIERHTGIRVPHALHDGMTEKSPVGLGPFIVMEYIENDSDLVDALNIPGRSDDDRPVLNPDIAEGRLRSAYSEMANLLPQIAKYSFNEIGCISNTEDDDFDDDWIVIHHPLTLNMNEFVQLGGYLPRFTSQPYIPNGIFLFPGTSRHIYHASVFKTKQRDYLRGKLSKKNRLRRHEHGPFKLFCDDFGPANVLTNSEHNYRIVGAIDREFSYCASAEFLYDPPSWLLLERPEYWEEGLED